MNILEFHRIAAQHKTPRRHALAAVSVAGLMLLMFHLCTREARARALIVASCFTAIEAGTYTATGRGTFSSVDQFFANVIYVAVVLDRWQLVGPSDLLNVVVSNTAIRLWRVALSPVSIWFLELVQNYTLIALFGRIRPGATQAVGGDISTGRST